MRLSREPFYPLLLAFFRKLFSSFANDFYLTAVAFFQSILMAAATWILVRYIWKELKLPKLIAFLSLLMPLLLSPFYAVLPPKRIHVFQQHSTEGIAISLYLLFFRYLLSTASTKAKKPFLSSILVFIMISTRKQMFVTLALLVFMYPYRKCNS